MISQETFFKLCSLFELKYSRAKKDLSSLETLSNSLVSPIQKSIREFGKTECRSGCSHCCYLRVEAFSYEIISIYLYINKKTDLEKNTLKRNIEEQYRKIQYFSQEEHFITNIQCPLLINRECSVYKVRPISCAGYHSTSEKQCKKSYDHPEITDENNISIPQSHAIDTELSIQNTVAIRVIESKKDDRNRYEIIRGLHNLFKKPQIIQRWKNGRKLKELSQ